MSAEAIALARRFEPILYFHPKERFFPADAKRYIERCALWKAQAPFDDKESWGGIGQPFDRKPLIPHGKMVASDLPGEIRPGQKYLGDPGEPYLTSSPQEGRFLELAGWKIPPGWPGDVVPVVELHEPRVTQTSVNRYASRNEVHRLYAGEDPFLRSSQFWYHAELFDSVRLRTLMMQTPAGELDLSGVFQKLVPSHPALLCYYFFFPGHDETLASPCDAHYWGTEFASFAGEWACLAVLLGRSSPAEEYQPRYFGCSGRYNRTIAGIDRREPRVGMRVFEWKAPSSVEVLDGHPKLYVSLGTHSLYPDGGDHPVAPYPVSAYPQMCGLFDGPDLLEQHLKANPPPEPPSAGAIVAKIVGGLYLGGLALIAGLVWAGVEKFGTIGSGTYDPPTAPMPDVAPPPGGAGKVVHPASVSLTDPGTEFVTWAADEGVIVDGRTYNFIVNRESQVWWPSDDGAAGYRGAWGPRVTKDPFGRRAGMLFPQFWRMFFAGLIKKAPPEFGL